MNIVFLRSNPVNPDSRVEKEVNALLKNNHNVIILAWDRSSKTKIQKSPNSTLKIADIDDIR